LVIPVDYSIDGETSIEILFIGVHEYHADDKARFIIIKRNPEIQKYFVNPEFSGYSAVYRDDTQVCWYRCMEM
jgi:hypothetical protein